jgi:lipopolysaccharide/colanic/teichoic acid biosynthesis glycosyltransferase
MAEAAMPAPAISTQLIERRGAEEVRLPREILLDTSIRYNQAFYQVAKRVFDIVVSAALIVMLSPILIAVALAIALQDGFPVVFKQKRLGYCGETFFIYKFRTMVKNAEEVLRSRPDLMEEYRRTYKITNDPRISKLGKFLRESSLDELPQLFNVLLGSMSLVGPRPIVEPELAKYGENAELYLAMKPGCAGLWQCSGRSDTTYDERVALDREYYHRSSLRYDVRILYRTFLSVVNRKGAR